MRTRGLEEEEEVVEVRVEWLIPSKEVGKKGVSVTIRKCFAISLRQTIGRGRARGTAGRDKVGWCWCPWLTLDDDAAAVVVWGAVAAAVHRNNLQR